LSENILVPRKERFIENVHILKKVLMYLENKYSCRLKRCAVLKKNVHMFKKMFMSSKNVVYEYIYRENLW
jgi:hypothetical protein